GNEDPVGGLAERPQCGGALPPVDAGAGRMHSLVHVAEHARGKGAPDSARGAHDGPPRPSHRRNMSLRFLCADAPRLEGHAFLDEGGGDSLALTLEGEESGCPALVDE